VATPKKPGRELQTDRDARAARDARAWELRTRCWTQERIAAELKVDQGTISRVLRRLEARALREIGKKVERVKARQTEQLEFIASEAMGEWERSKKDTERIHTVERTTKNPDGTTTTTTTDETVEGRTGDSTLLEQARGALKDIRAIWGLDAPKKIEAEVQAVKLYDVANSPEDL
jgi:DNA-binding transcriptional MocR family regulator